MILVAVAVVGGCTDRKDAGPRPAPNASTTTSTASATDNATTTRSGTPTKGSTATTEPVEPVEPLAWSSCDESFECATVDVPVDYARPGGASLELVVVRRPAEDPKRRIGALFMNPGGPGGSAIDLVESIALPREITRRFDVIGFDPRGVGRSTPLDCRSHLQQIYDDDPTMEDRADRATFLADSQAFVDECARKYRNLLPHLGSRDVARDMDRIRAALGDRQLDYLGFSYGTVIGQQYAALFPERVRAMVLDGVVDLSVDGLESAQGQAAGFSAALDAFIASCGTGSACGLDDPAGSVIDEVLADSEAEAIPARRTDRPATPGVINLALAQALYSDALWPELARALDQGRDGNGSGLVRLADDYLRRDADGSYPNGFEIYFAVTCLDQDFPRDPKRVMDVAKVVGAAYPRIGEGLVNDYVRCALWPAPSQPLEPVPATTRGLPPTLVISTTGDPATPYVSGARVAEQIPHAVLVTNEGEGHTIFGQGKDCIDDAVTAYLIEEEVPGRGLVCS